MKEINILNKVPTTLLLSIEEDKRNISNLTRKIGFSAPYTHNTVSWLVEKKLIAKKRIDKKSYSLSLTKKGKEIVKHINEIKKLID